jgi:hypothetical protein
MMSRDAPSAALTVLLCFLGAICEGFDVQAAGVAAAGVSHLFRPTPHAVCGEDQCGSVGDG